MVFLKAFFSCVLFCLSFACFGTFASEMDGIIDKKPKLHLCTPSVSGKDASFFVEKYIGPDKSVFESFRFVADDISKRWNYRVSFSNQKPSEISDSRTLNFTEDNYALLHTCLADPGSDVEDDFVNGGYKIQTASSVSEFLSEIKKLPKFVMVDNDNHYGNTRCNYRNVLLGAAASACIYLIYHYSHRLFSS